MRLPFLLQLIFNALIILISTLWLDRTWDRSEEEYNKESLAYKLRRQLKKLSFNFSQLLQGRSLDELNSHELYLLASVLPNATRQEYYRIYKGILEEALSEKRFKPDISKEALQQLRQKLQLQDEEHDCALAEIIQEKPNLLNSFTSTNSGLSLARTKLRAVRNNHGSLRDSAMEEQSLLGLRQSGIKPIQKNYLPQASTQIKRVRDKKQRNKNDSQVLPTKIKDISDRNDRK